MSSRWRQTCNSLNWREMRLALFLSLPLPLPRLRAVECLQFQPTSIIRREHIFCNSPNSVRISVSTTRSIRHMRRDGRHGGQGETGDWLTRLNLIARESFVLHNCTEELSSTAAYIMLITCHSLLPLIEYEKRKYARTRVRGAPRTHARHALAHDYPSRSHAIIVNTPWLLTFMISVNH